MSVQDTTQDSSAQNLPLKDTDGATHEGGAHELSTYSDASPQNGRTEVSPLHQDGYEPFHKPQTKGCVKHGEGLTVIIISSVTFAVAITVALIVTIFYGPPQVPPHGVVTCDVPVCSDIGVNILKKGGSAVDAAIATTLCVGVVNAHSSGIGGGGFMLVHTHKDMKTKGINFRETAPSGVTKDATVTQAGMSIATPAELKGLKQAHDTYGVLSWSDVVTPAANLATKGFNVTKDLADSILNIKPLSSDLSKVFAPKGIAVKEGDFIKRPDYGKTLKLVAENGVDAVYAGSVADNIVNSISSAGGILSKDDLKNYKVNTENAVQALYQNFTVLSLPPPSGGAAVLSMLRILEAYDLTHADGTKNLTYHHIIEAMKFGYGQFYQLGDPTFTSDMHNFTSLMLSDEEVKRIQNLIKDDGTLPMATYGSTVGMQSSGTQHISVISPEDQIVSITTSIGGDFGSQIMTADGIILNNHMTDFSKSVANQVKANKRPLSPMSPIIMHSSRRPCGLRLAVGGASGNSILSGILDVIVRLTSFSLPLKDSVNTPRFQNTLIQNVVQVEDGFSTKVEAFLKRLGHKVQRADNLNAVNTAIKINETVSGQADPRRSGRSSVY